MSDGRPVNARLLPSCWVLTSLLVVGPASDSSATQAPVQVQERIHSGHVAGMDRGIVGGDLLTRYYMIGASALLLLQSMLIAALLLHRSRRRRAERILRENQRRYALATAAGATGVWDWRLQTNDLYVDPQLKLILGFQDDELPNHLEGWRRRVHPEDTHALMERTRACIEGREDTFEAEHRMMHKDGSIRWFLARGSVIRDAHGTAFRMVGTETDITDRKWAQGEIQESEAALRASHAEIRNLAGRLIMAQEAERSRIARELHDDVSQQLAGVSITLSGLKQRLSDVHCGEELHGVLASLQQRMIALAESIRHLSHDLHPGVLRHAGLVAALRAHCDEIARHQSVTVTLHADDDFAAIRLSPESELCLYRVAQEALRNTIKHADARRADVRLRRAIDGVELTVADDGRGFEIADGNRNGLGLRSIHERVRQAGGTASIVATLPHGTTVRPRVPIQARTGEAVPSRIGIPLERALGSDTNAAR